MGPRRIVIVVAALAVVVGAVAWVEAPFTDGGAHCGTALGAARHGFPVPELNGRAPTDLAGRPVDFAMTTANTRWVTYCQGQARARLVESAVAVGVAAFGVVTFGRKRRGPAPPGLAMA